MRHRLVAFTLLATALTLPAHTSAAEPRVRDLKITVLSTMLAGNPMFRGIGEWGFAALVEADGKRILFDTGLRPQTVLRNAHELGVDLTGIETVVLTHNHNDHIGGLMTLRREFMGTDARAYSRVHVGRGIFWSRGADSKGIEDNAAIALKAEFEATGGTFLEHAGPVELAPGVWFTGPIPRPNPEKNYGGTDRVLAPDGWTADIVQEDSALVFDTRRGLVVLSGCGHAGMINTLAYACTVTRETRVHAAIGGFHLLSNTDEGLAWTAARLREFGVVHLLNAHCTGIEASFRLRDLAGLDRATSVVAAVGATFDLERGIDPLMLAR
ncbi:MAG: MBL fold metallo-hydrolase [Opitutaceae bacterium]|nr:MBL fold metallo-hydrolase [Opitutaceae bacterium]